MTKWRRIDDVVPEIAAEPWSLFWGEMDVPSVELEAFMTDPLSALKLKVPEMDATWRVNTSIIGHEISLNAHGGSTGPICMVLLLDPRSKTGFVTLYKH
jgi:hypothetical protein